MHAHIHTSRHAHTHAHTRTYAHKQQWARSRKRTSMSALTCTSDRPVSMMPSSSCAACGRHTGPSARASTPAHSSASGHDTRLCKHGRISSSSGGSSSAWCWEYCLLRPRPWPKHQRTTARHAQTPICGHAAWQVSSTGTCYTRVGPYLLLTRHAPHACLTMHVEVPIHRGWPVPCSPELVRRWTERFGA